MDGETIGENWENEYCQFRTGIRNPGENWWNSFCQVRTGITQQLETVGENWYINDEISQVRIIVLSTYTISQKQKK